MNGSSVTSMSVPIAVAMSMAVSYVDVDRARAEVQVTDEILGNSVVDGAHEVVDVKQVEGRPALRYRWVAIFSERLALSMKLWTYLGLSLPTPYTELGRSMAHRRPCVARQWLIKVFAQELRLAIWDPWQRAAGTRPAIRSCER